MELVYIWFSKRIDKDGNLYRRQHAFLWTRGLFL